jgi:hypothetical protein
MLPSSDTNPTATRKLLLILLTLMPCNCTICGSSGVACCSLFCTCTCAVSGFVPLAKVRTIETLPALSLVDAM